MEITGKYINIVTGEILGYRVTNKIFSVPCSERIAKELCPDDAGILQYLECEIIESLDYMGKVYLIDNQIGTYDEDKPDGIDGEYIWVDGYCFDRYSGGTLDSELAIQRMKTGIDI